MPNQDNFNKKGLRKITEQYLTSLILQEDIIGFLEKNVNTKRSISNVLAERAGKATNTIYRNINQLEIFNAISLLRYWKALIEICREYKIPEEKIPNLNSLLSKYDETLSFLNHITTEDKIETLVDVHLNTILKIITFYKKHSSSITESEKHLLTKLETHPEVRNVFKEREELNKKAIKERMEKK
ncbi:MULTISPECIES: hypothetical protein [Lysinibacillus]|uniref:hypothetical protein n=1 Tax=Lysinibacillus TaxID=400634 RepID=UPI002DB61C38|nr:hypothetical protein [Lysinibacillus sphaericus]MEB7454370.1 hypothetical protein [Lysinibacillus sphaericus]WKT76885.1 hypothetical protein QYY55_23085 [Lysinibacillus fusiformis]